MTSNVFRPGERVRHLFVLTPFAETLYGTVVGRHFNHEPAWGLAEWYVVDWDDGKRQSIPADNLRRVDQDV